VAVDSSRSWGQSCLASGPVSGDVDAVALFAFPIGLPFGSSGHGVFGSELMTTVAMRSAGFGMNTMSDKVEVIFGNRSVGDVFGDIVELVPVDVSGHHPIGARTMKNHSYDVVNPEVFLSPIVCIEDDARVSLAVDSRLENSFWGALPGKRQNFTEDIDPVIAKAGDVYPVGASHDVTIQDPNMLCKKGIN